MITGQKETYYAEYLQLHKVLDAQLPKSLAKGNEAHDEMLFHHLRQLRKNVADERDVPAYVVFSDVALRQMAREYPANEREFMQISGVGSRKLQEFGTVFLNAIADYLETQPRQRFSGESSSTLSPSVSSMKKPLGKTVQETLRCFRSGLTVEDIATQRGLVRGTIYGHLEQAIQAGEAIDHTRLLTADQQSQIAVAFAQTGFGNLTGAKELLGDLFDYGQLRLFRVLHGKNVSEQS
mgnify:CR=1 FL=1